MTMTPEKLDQLLDQMSNQQSSDSSDFAKSITGELKSFMSHRSDFEGAEIPEYSTKSKKQKISFDPDAFSDAVTNILGMYSHGILTQQCCKCIFTPDLILQLLV